jgi:hypothetical protein
VTNLVLTLVVALAALYAADRMGWLPELGDAPARSDTTRSVEIAEPIPQAPELAAVAPVEPLPDPEAVAPPLPFQEERLEPDPIAQGATDPIAQGATDPIAELAPESELDAAPPRPAPAESDRSAALVRRMLSLYRRGGERR